MPTRVDTSRFLTIYDIKNLNHAFTLAYLASKGLDVSDVQNPEVDNGWNYGTYEEGLIIRTEDNALFTLTTTPMLTSDGKSIDKMVIGGGIQERFLEIIAYFIANDHKKLPCQNLKIAMCLNHGDAHWTQLLASFEGIDQKEYAKIYQAYQKHAKETGEDKDERGKKLPLHRRMRRIRNFLIDLKGMELNRTINGVEQLSNCVLPLPFKKQSLTHYDSLGENTSYQQNAHAAAVTYLSKHGIDFQVGRCVKQKGATCGDYTTFNAWNYGVFAKPRHPGRDSVDLRKTQNYPSLKNAHQILFAQKPNITKCKEAEKITIVQEEADFAFGETSSHIPAFVRGTPEEQALLAASRAEQEDQGKARKASSTSTKVNTKPHRATKPVTGKIPSQTPHQPQAQPQAQTQTQMQSQQTQQSTTTPSNSLNSKNPYNHAYPLTRLFSRLALGIFAGFLTFVFLPTIASIPFLIPAIIATFTAIFGFEYLTKHLFGVQKMIVKSEKGVISAATPDDKEAMCKNTLFEALSGFGSPYHHTLQELETEISQLTPSEKNHEVRMQLTRQYAKQIVTANPTYFYDEDVEAVKKEEYVRQRLH